MTPRAIINRIIVLGFMVLVGYSLARSIHYKSVMGIILALTSLGAAIYFLHLLVKARQMAEQKETA